jgi:two-component system response regulator AtoC
LSPEAMEILLRYDWPGNVRELKGAIDSGVTLATGNQITIRDLPRTVRGASGALAPREDGNQDLVNIHANEIRLITRALDESGGNRTEAAKKLGISRRTLHRRLKELQLP